MEHLFRLAADKLGGEQLLGELLVLCIEAADDGSITELDHLGIVLEILGGDFGGDTLAAW